MWHIPSQVEGIYTLRTWQLKWRGSPTFHSSCEPVRGLSVSKVSINMNRVGFWKPKVSGCRDCTKSEGSQKNYIPAIVISRQFALKRPAPELLRKTRPQCGWSSLPYVAKHSRCTGISVLLEVLQWLYKAERQGWWKSNFQKNRTSNSLAWIWCKQIIVTCQLYVNNVMIPRCLQY